MSNGGPRGLNRRGLFNAAAAGLGAAAVAGLGVACSGPGVRTGSSGRGTGAADDRDLADAVIEAFKTHRLVGLGEVHNLQEHHDALGRLLADPRLPGVVDDIVVEFGDAFYQTMMDKFIIDGQPVNNADLRLAWRNTTVSPLSTWDEPVYEQFFRAVRAANWALPPRRRMRVLLGDPPIDWPKITKGSQVAAWSRDAYPASVVEGQVLGKSRRALLCYGMVHLFHSVPKVHLPPNLVSILQQRTGERTYVIADLVPFAGDPGGLARKLSPYSRDMVIPAAGTWLGSFDAGLVAQLTLPTGGNPFCGVPLRSIVDAGLYVGQAADLTQSYWNPAIFLDPAYWAELQRRNALMGDPVNLDSYREEQPVRFPLLKVARSAECSQAEQPR